MIGEQLLLGIIILSLIAASGAVVVWRLWVGMKKLYNDNDHDVPVNMRLGMFAVGCCVLVVPVYLIVALVSIS